MKNMKVTSMILTLAMIASLGVTGCGGAEKTYQGTASAADNGIIADGATVEGWGESSGDSPVKDFEDPVIYGSFASIQGLKGFEGEAGATEVSGETYSEIEENKFISTAENNISTFSADVDTASYSNIRRMLSNGYAPVDIPVGAVRVEEMLNYFDYELSNKTDDKFSFDYEIGGYDDENSLLVITAEANGAVETKANNFVFLIDSSGSMDDELKMPLVKESFKKLTSTLNENDRVSIVTYSGETKTVLDSCEGNNKDKIEKALDSINTDGGTNGGQGIIDAYALAKKNFIEGGNNRVIMASDGDLNVGVSTPEELDELITEKKDDGIFLTVLGFGQGNYNDSNMETLADKGNGNYYYIDNINEAERVLVDKLKQTTITVAKDAKFQIEFDKDSVKEYKQIGYENRQLNTEDFEDDTKDGGEVGAGQQVTVAYLIKFNEGANKVGKLSVNYKEPDAKESSTDEYEISFEAVKDTNTKQFNFTKGVIQVAELLRNQKNDKKLAKEAYENVKGNGLGDKYREEFIEAVKILAEVTDNSNDNEKPVEEMYKYSVVLKADPDYLKKMAEDFKAKDWCKVRYIDTKNSTITISIDRHKADEFQNLITEIEEKYQSLFEVVDMDIQY